MANTNSVDVVFRIHPLEGKTRQRDVIQSGAMREVTVGDGHERTLLGTWKENVSITRLLYYVSNLLLQDWRPRDPDGRRNDPGSWGPSDIEYERIYI